jgi:hypothetical protein
MTDLGFLIAISASVVALYGVWLFNQRRDYTGARSVWMFSNVMFTVYFFGRVMTYWNGSLGDLAMLVYFAAMTASNVWGCGVCDKAMYRIVQSEPQSTKDMYIEYLARIEAFRKRNKPEPTESTELTETGDA